MGTPANPATPRYVGLARCPHCAGDLSAYAPVPVAALAAAEALAGLVASGDAPGTVGALTGATSGAVATASALTPTQASERLRRATGAGLVRRERERAARGGAAYRYAPLPLLALYARSGTPAGALASPPALGILAPRVAARMTVTPLPPLPLAPLAGGLTTEGALDAAGVLALLRG